MDDGGRDWVWRVEVNSSRQLATPDERIAWWAARQHGYVTRVQLIAAGLDRQCDRLSGAGRAPASRSSRRLRRGAPAGDAARAGDGGRARMRARRRAEP